MNLMFRFIQMTRTQQNTRMVLWESLSAGAFLMQREWRYCLAGQKCLLKRVCSHGWAGKVVWTTNYVLSRLEISLGLILEPFTPLEQARLFLKLSRAPILRIVCMTMIVWETMASLIDLHLAPELRVIDYAQGSSNIWRNYCSRNWWQTELMSCSISPVRKIWDSWKAKHAQPWPFMCIVIDEGEGTVFALTAATSRAPSLQGLSFIAPASSGSALRVLWRWLPLIFLIQSRMI